MSTIPPGPGADPGDGARPPDPGPPLTIEDPTEESSIGRDFVQPQSSGGGFARNAIIVDKENLHFTEMPMDPIRRDAVAHWVIFNDPSEEVQSVRWARGGRYQEYVETNAKISNIQYRVSSDDRIPSSLNPYGVRTETIRLTYKDVFEEAGTGVEVFVDYLRSAGFASVGRTYLDHALEYQEAYSSTENRVIYDGSPGFNQLIADVKFDYNFYTKLYEQNLDRYGISETLSPHIYTFYLEKERGLTSGDSAFYGDEIDVGFTEPRINQDGYVDQWIYNDFITLNRSSEMQRVFINAIRETSLSSEKSGEIDRGEYYDIWASRYPDAIAGSVDTTSGPTPLSNGIAILSEKYRNMLIPLTTEDRIHTSYNSYKELFPMFAEIQYSQTTPNQIVKRLSLEDGPEESLPALNNLMRDVVSDFENLRGSAETTFASYRSFGENHERIYTDPGNTTYTLPVGGTAERRIFDIGQWALGEEFVDFDESSYLFLKNFSGEEAESTLSDLLIIRRNTDIIDDTSSGLSVLSSNMRAMLLELANNNRRTYEDIMSGDRAYSEDVFFKVSKYFVSPEGVRSIIPMQSFYLLNNGHNRSVVNFIDTQLRYGRTYEYEIHTCRLVVGTQTRIVSARYFDPETFTIRTDGEPGFRVTGNFRPVTMGEVTFVGGSPGGSGPFETAIPSEFLSDGEQIYLVDVDLELTPSIKLIELPYASSVTSGINILRGTVLDDPPMPPEVEVYPYRAVNNELLFLLNTGAGSKEYEPIAFTPQEQLYINRLRSMNTDPNKIEILYENDDPSTKFEVYRTDRKPTSYDDFREKIFSTIDTRDALIGYRNASSTSFRSKVLPNKKYYYLFRAIDVHGHASYPSPVYEIELIDSDGAVFPVVKTIEIKANERRKTKFKKLNRFLKISPTFLQSVLNSNDPSMQTAERPPTSTELPVGVQDESVWERSFKIRLTSRKTGRKLDLNIKCKKEYDDRRPAAIPPLRTAGVAPLPDSTAPLSTAGVASIPTFTTPSVTTTTTSTPSAVPGGSIGTSSPPGIIGTRTGGPTTKPTVPADDTGVSTPPLVPVGRGRIAVNTRDPDIPTLGRLTRTGTRVFRDFPPAPYDPPPPRDPDPDLQSSVDDPKARRRRDDS